jgi:hypothetical protein
MVILVKLAELLDRTNLDVLDHLDRSVSIPVLDGLQAQGDLIVIPSAMVTTVDSHAWSRWVDLPGEGFEVVRGVAGNNPHTFVADPCTCRFTLDVFDPLGLAVVLLENSAPAYLIHPEHGGSGIAPGRWVVRRQQERGVFRRSLLVVD